MTQFGTWVCPLHQRLREEDFAKSLKIAPTSEACDLFCIIVAFVGKLRRTEKSKSCTLDLLKRLVGGGEKEPYDVVIIMKGLCYIVECGQKGIQYANKGLVLIRFHFY